MDIKQIKNLVTQRKYRLTLHAEVERDAEEITLQEIEEAILSKDAEIIEDYPNDPRGPSCLILGFTRKNFPLHIVCGIASQEILVMVTVYRPDVAEWIDFRIRKETKS